MQGAVVVLRHATRHHAATRHAAPPRAALKPCSPPPCSPTGRNCSHFPSLRQKLPELLDPKLGSICTLADSANLRGFVALGAAGAAAGAAAAVPVTHALGRRTGIAAGRARGARTRAPAHGSWLQARSRRWCSVRVAAQATGDPGAAPLLGAAEAPFRAVQRRAKALPLPDGVWPIAPRLWRNHGCTYSSTLPSTWMVPGILVFIMAQVLQTASVAPPMAWIGRLLAGAAGGLWMQAAYLEVGGRARARMQAPPRTRDSARGARTQAAPLSPGTRGAASRAAEPAGHPAPAWLPAAARWWRSRSQITAAASRRSSAPATSSACCAAGSSSLASAADTAARRGASYTHGARRPGGVGGVGAGGGRGGRHRRGAHRCGARGAGVLRRVAGRTAHGPSHGAATRLPGHDVGTAWRGPHTRITGPSGLR